MRNMGFTLANDEYIARFEYHRFLFVTVAEAHLDNAVQHRKYLGAIILVPAIRLIRPMETDAGAGYFGQVSGAPGTRSYEGSDIINDHWHR